MSVSGNGLHFAPTNGYQGKECVCLNPLTKKLCLNLASVDMCVASELLSQ